MSGSGYRDSTFYTMVFKHNTREKAIETINSNIKHPSFPEELECAMRTFYMFYDNMSLEQAKEKALNITKKKISLEQEAERIKQLQSAIVSDALDSAAKQQSEEKVEMVPESEPEKIASPDEEKRKKKLESLAKAREARKAKKVNAVGFSDLPNAE